MKTTLLFSSIIIVLLVGCGPEEKPDQLKAVNNSLESSNKIIAADIETAREEILQMQTQPQTFQIADILIPRINRIHQYADSIYVMVENLKREVIAQSDSFKMEYVTVIKQLYDVNGTGAQFVNKLSVFIDSIPAIFTPGEAGDNTARQTSVDNEMKRLQRTLPLLPGYEECTSVDQRTKYKNQWLSKSFGRTSSLMAMVMLNKIESDALTTEKMLIEYCNNSVAIGCILRFDQFESVALLNSSYVKKGQTIKVRAGVGSFSVASKPTITIDGKVIALNGGVIAIYDFIANGSPGKHTVPVKFEYTKPDGSIEIVTRVLEYIIADEK